ncbi:MAG: SMI1/KNR4 family protein [Myxococcales bacterium]|nr:SMI1/KNR4 family protein [Myxococcales bacterium]
MDFEALLRFVEPYLDKDFRPPLFDPTIAATVLPSAGRSQMLHDRVLRWHNGFYVFGGLLHVLGSCGTPPNHSILAWNDAGGWRRSFGPLTEGCVFFAQTAFGDQFAYRGGKIVRLRALEGRTDAMAASLDEWLQTVILDPDFALDKRLFDACVKVHGPLPHGGHFAPTMPYDPSLALDPARMQIAPTRDSMETKGELVRSGLFRRRSSMSFRPVS